MPATEALLVRFGLKMCVVAEAGAMIKYRCSNIEMPYLTLFTNPVAADRRGAAAAGRVGPALFHAVAFSVVARGIECYPVGHELLERRPPLLGPDRWGVHGRQSWCQRRLDKKKKTSTSGNRQRQ